MLISKLILVVLCGAVAACASVYSYATVGHVNRDRLVIPRDAKVVMLTGTYTPNEDTGEIFLPRGLKPFFGNEGLVERGDEVIGYVRCRFSYALAGNFVYGGVPGALGDLAIGGAWDLYYVPKNAFK